MLLNNFTPFVIILSIGEYYNIVPKNNCSFVKYACSPLTDSFKKII